MQATYNAARFGDSSPKRYGFIKCQIKNENIKKGDNFNAMYTKFSIEIVPDADTVVCSGSDTMYAPQG